MIVVCINNDNMTGGALEIPELLTLDKFYDVKGVHNILNLDTYYRIIDDRGIACYYKACRFMSVGEYRQKNINEMIK